ncbi:Ca2+/Na+ antiporter [Alkalihalobacillus xiaoxiensis]|uniref:Ca2+/Na+ antiporter n=1 Tax=Shouchella xiaoxiensis TaxID=766895 RepID=A0ABS2SPH6_9BACI|nr:DUF4181 domain-containing protein [Shouchella xiaoxiensis]MBM7836906.1 Ca2+/Na+ antiporter [Shouchella xiaoxiensis]
MYVSEQNFWGPFLLIMLVFLLLLWIFNWVTRKLLKVEKKPLFSYNHITEKHKKVDWTIRITFIVSVFVNVFITVSIPGWPVQPGVLIIIFIIVLEIARAVFEKKYAENENDYKFTLYQLGFIVLLFSIILFSGVFERLFF